MTEQFDQEKFQVQDINELEIKCRILDITQQYPTLTPFLYALTQMESNKSGWIEVANEIRIQAEQAHVDFASVVKEDPDFPMKYKFALTLAIIENPSVDSETAEQVIQIVFGEEE